LSSICHNFQLDYGLANDGQGETIMAYDENGLGIAEMTFISINYPETWETMEKAFDDNKDKEALEIARKTIKLHNQKKGA
jgi:hypothetical protein